MGIVLYETHLINIKQKSKFKLSCPTEKEPSSH
jgi:hypothetical protein